MNSKVIERRFEELKDRITDVNLTIKRSSEGYSDEVDQETFMTWGMSVMTLLSQVFGLESLQNSQFKGYYNDFDGLIEDYKKCKAVFNAAYDDYMNGYIFSLRGLVAADLMEDGLSQAEDLLNANHKDPACIVAGVCLETTLKELCDREKLSHGKLDKMNADLKKAGVYNTGMQKQITAWADLRNNAAHGNWKEYTDDDVKLMIQGIRCFISINV
ncbi:conserved protein of unknown function [Petrocella atlantisensis]|uniref:Uncharacterized protein n=1 Tax=Petrocella atlantisensis TaxID=2173034 RepID=A0A3P7PCS3_9FIRM|nr:DUF4145 domain-containing protein [Petrocella atlantisensis]VDN46688.1 conserved protein of unknown function [Petrocella atlantisensis]